MIMASDNENNVVSIWERSDPNADINEMKNFVEAEPPPEARDCTHPSILVNEYHRSITCRHCHATLEPFEYLLRLAKKETRIDWDLRALRAEIKRRREGLDNLKREETNTRARIKTASFRLNDINVAINAASDSLLELKGCHGKR